MGHNIWAVRYINQLASSSFKQTEKNNMSTITLEKVLVNAGAGVSTHHIQSFPAQIPEMMHSWFDHSKSYKKMMWKTITADLK